MNFKRRENNQSRYNKHLFCNKRAKYFTTLQLSKRETRHNHRKNIGTN
jgi:hypothetical protein